MVKINAKKQKEEKVKREEDVDDLKLLLKRFNRKVAHIDDLLAFCSQYKCSDLYISIGKKPYIKRYGMLYEVPSYNSTESVWNNWSKLAINMELNTKYIREKKIDISYSIDVDRSDKEWKSLFGEMLNNKNITNLRYRVTCGYSMGKKTAVFRMITPDLPSFFNLEFPDSIVNILKEASKKHSGITVLAGATGSGKSTTMAAVINDFTQPLGTLDNSTIISLEDPVEYVYSNRNHVNIIQKELDLDFKSFDSGVKQALREHPTAINIGETRDKDTIRALVEASRSGHLIYTSFHASGVADTISRMYNHLVTDNPEVMFDLVTQMNLILCQRIVANGERFILETQYMIFNDDIIRMINQKIANSENITMVIEDMFKDEKLKSSGILKDWN